MSVLFSISPFLTSLAAAFDNTVQPEELQQMRTVLRPHAPINFVVFFRHTPTTRVLAYDLMTNTWSDATSLRDWEAQSVPHLSYPSDPFSHMTTRLR